MVHPVLHRIHTLGFYCSYIKCIFPLLTSRKAKKEQIMVPLPAAQCAQWTEMGEISNSPFFKIKFWPSVGLLALHVLVQGVPRQKFILQCSPKQLKKLKDFVFLSCSFPDLCLYCWPFLICLKSLIPPEVEYKNHITRLYQKRQFLNENCHFSSLC